MKTKPDKLDLLEKKVHKCSLLISKYLREDDPEKQKAMKKQIDLLTKQIKKGAKEV